MTVLSEIIIELLPHPQEKNGPAFLPVVEATLILQALLHCAIDGGLSAVFWGLDEVHEWSVQDSLPQGDLNHKVASQFGPDDSRVQAVSCYSSSCRCKKRHGP